MTTLVNPLTELVELMNPDAPRSGAEPWWRDQSLCHRPDVDPEIFFAGGGRTIKAKKLCRSCPVRQLCLEHALAHDERFGVWGGLTRDERRQLKKQRRQQHPPQ